MKTKPVYVYWCATTIPGVGLLCEASPAKESATRARRRDIAQDWPVGPIVRVDVPLPPTGRKRPPS